MNIVREMGKGRIEDDGGGERGAVTRGGGWHLALLPTREGTQASSWLNGDASNQRIRIR
jgi:hypothetical protein